MFMTGWLICASCHAATSVASTLTSTLPQQRHHSSSTPVPCTLVSRPRRLETGKPELSELRHQCSAPKCPAHGQLPDHINLQQSENPFLQTTFTALLLH
eukprot:1041495-Pelagomonas_calceolata.AAC.2